MPEFIEAVVKATGRKQRVPAAWRGTPLWEPFKMPPSAGKKKPEPEPAPEEQPEG